MLKKSYGEIIGSLPQTPVRGGVAELEAVSVDDAARISGFCRSFLYPALNPDPAKRKGLPYLPSLKVRKARRIRLSTLRQWLADLERAQQPGRQDPEEGAMSGATFTPTVEWQDVPDGAALPGDRQVEMNQTAGRTRARLMPELERHLDQRARCRDAPEDQPERPRLQVGGRPER